MGEPFMHYDDPFNGIASEIISAMSALNMEPEPMQKPVGKFLSESDKWVHHAMEHLKRAMDLHREAYGKIEALKFQTITKG